MTEKMPSSSRFGSRPRCLQMSTYSAAVSPCCAMTSGECTIGDSSASEQRSEDGPPIEVAEQGLRVALRVGHQPQHVARRIHHPGDGGGGTIGVVIRVAKGHLPLAFEPPAALVL